MTDTITISTEHIKQLVAPKHPSSLRQWLPNLRVAINKGTTVTFVGVDGSDILVPTVFPAALVLGEFTRPLEGVKKPDYLLSQGYYKGYQFALTPTKGRDYIEPIWNVNKYCNLDMPRSFTWLKDNLVDLPSHIDKIHFGDVIYDISEEEYKIPAGPIEVRLSCDRLVNIIAGHERLSCPKLSYLYLLTNIKKESFDPRLVISALLTLEIIQGQHFEDFVKMKGETRFFSNLDALHRIEKIKLPETIPDCNFTFECVKTLSHIFWQIYKVSQNLHSTDRAELLKWVVAEFKKDTLIYNIFKNDHTNSIREIIQLVRAQIPHDGFKRFTLPSNIKEATFLLDFIDDLVKALNNAEGPSYVPSPLLK